MRQCWTESSFSRHRGCWSAVCSICDNFVVCGRYKLSRRKQVGEEYFDAVSSEEDWNPRYNIAPTQPVPMIRQHPKEPVREMSLMRWGLIPSWAKDSSGAARMINARSETAAKLPAFRDAMKSRRCLIPADGFYEWKRDGKIKQPFRFESMKGHCLLTRRGLRLDQRTMISLKVMKVKHRILLTCRSIAGTNRNPGAGESPRIQAAGLLRKGRSRLGFRVGSRFHLCCQVQLTFASCPT